MSFSKYRKFLLLNFCINAIITSLRFLSKKEKVKKMIRLKNVILHVLDKNSGSLVCSQKEIDATDPLVFNYIEKLVKKIEQAEVKTGSLENTEFSTVIFDEKLNFLEKSSEVAKRIYTIIASSEEVPAGDLLVIQYADELENNFFGVLKLNYTQKYSHFVDYENNLLINKLIINQAILPMPSQKIDECFIVDLQTKTFQLLEKKYSVEGEKIFYLSELLFKVIPAQTAQESIKKIKKTVNLVAEKFNEEKFVALSNTQKAVWDSIEQTGEIDAQMIAENIFEKNDLAKEEYLEIMSKSSSSKKVPVLNTPKYERKYSKQRFKLNNGIELTIPMDVYENKDLVEFINNIDGTISVVIKNVDGITNKFN